MMPPTMMEIPMLIADLKWAKRRSFLMLAARLVLIPMDNHRLLFWFLICICALISLYVMYIAILPNCSVAEIDLE